MTLTDLLQGVDALQLTVARGATLNLDLAASLQSCPRSCRAQRDPAVPRSLHRLHLLRPSPCHAMHDVDLLSMVKPARIPNGEAVCGHEV